MSFHIPQRGGPYQWSYHLLRHASRSYETTFVGFNLHGYTPSQLSECEAELRECCANVEFWEMPTALIQCFGSYCAPFASATQLAEATHPRLQAVRDHHLSLPLSTS